MLGGSMSARPRQRAPALPVAAALVRLAAGAVFIAFGVGKFTSHASELDSFRSYGLPFPDAFVYLIGVVEIVGGLLLLAGLRARPAAAVLALNMVGAIVVSGIGRGERISLTLAPALLVAMLFLLWRGPGALTLCPARPRA
jgi:putative oxidoreductase